MFALKEMPLAAGWPLSGETLVMCGVVLLTHSADYSLHTETWNRTGQTTCQAIHFLTSFSMVHRFLRNILSSEEMCDIIRAQKGVQRLELCSYSFFSTTADSLHNPKSTTQNIFPRIKIWWSTKGKKSLCITGTSTNMCCNSIFPCLTYSCGNFPWGKT